MLLELKAVLSRRLPSAGCTCLLALTISAGSAGCTADQFPECVLEVPVYDGAGNKLDFKIASFTAEALPRVNLLSSGVFRGRGCELFFPKRYISPRRYKITLENAKGDKVEDEVSLKQCQQRFSITVAPFLDTGADVAWTGFRGRLVGCRLVGDWWIRAMPMYGQQGTPGSFEGHVRLSDGYFSLASSMRGERHIIVVGKGKEPVKALPLNVVVGADNNVGDVDLSGSCPP